jgi:hypothetical protein
MVLSGGKFEGVDTADLSRSDLERMIQRRWPPIETERRDREGAR